MENKDTKTNPCPEFPFFGARYPDARCIDGLLWDLDSCEEDPNVFTRGGETPCPFCNTDKFIENDPYGMLDHFITELTGENDPTDRQLTLAKMFARKFYPKEIEKLKERYGKQRH